MIVICNIPGAIHVIGLVGRKRAQLTVIVGFQNKIEERCAWKEIK